MSRRFSTILADSSQRRHEVARVSFFTVRHHKCYADVQLLLYAAICVLWIRWIRSHQKRNTMAWRLLWSRTIIWIIYIWKIKIDSKWIEFSWKLGQIRLLCSLYKSQNKNLRIAWRDRPFQFRVRTWYPDVTNIGLQLQHIRERTLSIRLGCLEFCFISKVDWKFSCIS